MWLKILKLMVTVLTLIHVSEQLRRDTVPEALYEPPLPRKELPRQIYRHESCCPESRCCGVQKMVARSQGIAEAELAKGVRAAAALGGVQADYNRRTAENALRSAEEDKRAATSILDANLEKNLHVAESAVDAADKELREIREKDVELEERQKAFVEEAAKELEEEAAQAENDLQTLEKEKHKLAELLRGHEAEALREEKRTTLEQLEANDAEATTQKEVAGNTRKVLNPQIPRIQTEMEEKRLEQQRLLDEVHAVEEQARNAENRANSVLVHAQKVEGSNGSAKAEEDFTKKQAEELEAEAAAAEHGAELEEESTAARLAINGKSDYRLSSSQPYQSSRFRQ